MIYNRSILVVFRNRSSIYILNQSGSVCVSLPIGPNLFLVGTYLLERFTFFGRRHFLFLNVVQSSTIYVAPFSLNFSIILPWGAFSPNPLEADMPFCYPHAPWKACMLVHCPCAVFEITCVYSFLPHYFESTLIHCRCAPLKVHMHVYCSCTGSSVKSSTKLSAKGEELGGHSTRENHEESAWKRTHVRLRNTQRVSGEAIQVRLRQNHTFLSWGPLWSCSSSTND